MSQQDTPAFALARELIPLVRRMGSFKGACATLGVSPARAAYTLMRAELYNMVLAAKYMEVEL